MNSVMHKTLLVIVSLAAPLAARANVIVVDQGGGGSFTQIQPAIDAAADGDTILVESGSYARFQVVNKSLAIVGDSGATVHVEGTLSVIGLAVERVLVLENLTVAAPPPALADNQHAIVVSENLGRVRIQNCALSGAGAAHCAALIVDGGDGVHCRQSADVALVGCTSVGGRGATDGNFTYGSGGAGIFAGQSEMTVYDSVLVGGNGGECYDGTWGGPGIVLRAEGILCGSKYQALGGLGGSSCGGCGCSYGGNGGDGTQVLERSILFRLDSSSFGAPGGHGNPGFSCTNVDGSSGHDYVISANSVLDPFAGQGRVMISASPVHANSTLTLEFHGAAGEHVSLFASDAADARLIPEWNATLLLDPRPPHGTTTNVGTIPGNGSLIVQIPIADPGVPSKILYFQPLFADAIGHKILGSPSSIVVLQ
jgi:hypothetical protein